MKSFVAVSLCAIIVIVSAAPATDETVKASALRLKEANDACHKGPITYMDRKGPGNPNEAPQISSTFGPYALCVSKHLGWQNADGSVNAEVIRDRATALFGENPKLNEIVTECVKDQGTPEATATHLLVQCYQKYAPH